MQESLPRRHPLRLKGYDYAQGGAYFVTVCFHDRECLLGKIAKGGVRLTPRGEIVRACWRDLPRHYPGLELDEFVVMPNHVHGILVIGGGWGDEGGGGISLSAPTDEEGRGGVSPPVSALGNENQGGATPPLRRPTLGQIVAFYKYQTTKRINEMRGTPGTAVWQRNYYEHIIRDENDLNRIREYIINNPFKWEEDTENPAGRGTAR